MKRVVRLWKGRFWFDDGQDRLLAVVICICTSDQTETDEKKKQNLQRVYDILPEELYIIQILYCFAVCSGRR